MCSVEGSPSRAPPGMRLMADPSSGDRSRQGPAHRRLRRKRAAGGLAGSGLTVRSEINVTPFVDVVLVLLIIFMVVTPMLQRGVDVVLPLSDFHTDKKDTGEQIIVSVGLDGRVHLGQEPVEPGRLTERLRPLLSRQPAPPIFVKGDRRLTFGPMRKVLEAIHRAGAPGASLATQARKEGGGG